MRVAATVVRGTAEQVRAISSWTFSVGAFAALGQWLFFISPAVPKPIYSISAPLTACKIAAQTRPSVTSRYIDKLETCCQMLADNPGLGRPCDEKHPGLQRMEQGKHVVFYRHREGAILVTRIVHQSMLPERQAIDGEGRQGNTASGPLGQGLLFNSSRTRERCGRLGLRA